MAQEKIQIKNASEALLRAQDENEIFLARLSPEELEKSGFDASDFSPYEYVDMYLQFWNGEYSLKYRFDSDPTTDHYEKPQVFPFDQQDNQQDNQEGM